MKKMKINTIKYLLIITAFSFVFSCDTQKSGDSNFTRLNRWLDYYGLALNDFSDTLIIENNYLIKTPLDTANINFKIFKDFYIYSPNQKFFLDLDSYFLVIEKNEQGKLVCYGSEADQEIALIDIKNQIRQRIIFCGTACRAEETQWINSELIYIMGFSEPEKNLIPVIWVFNRKNNSLKKLIANRTKTSNKPNSYNKNIRLKQIIFR